MTGANQLPSAFQLDPRLPEDAAAWKANLEEVAHGDHLQRLMAVVHARSLVEDAVRRKQGRPMNARVKNLPRELERLTGKRLPKSAKKALAARNRVTHTKLPRALSVEKATAALKSLFRLWADLEELGNSDLEEYLDGFAFHAPVVAGPSSVAQLAGPGPTVDVAMETDAPKELESSAEHRSSAWAQFRWTVLVVVVFVTNSWEFLERGMKNVTPETVRRQSARRAALRESVQLLPNTIGRQQGGTQSRPQNEVGHLTHKTGPTPPPEEVSKTSRVQAARPRTSPPLPVRGAATPPSPQRSRRGASTSANDSRIQAPRTPSAIITGHMSFDRRKGGMSVSHQGTMKNLTVDALDRLAASQFPNGLRYITRINISERNASVSGKVDDRFGSLSFSYSNGPHADAHELIRRFGDLQHFHGYTSELGPGLPITYSYQSSGAPRRSRRAYVAALVIGIVVVTIAMAVAAVWLTRG